MLKTNALLRVAAPALFLLAAAALPPVEAQVAVGATPAVGIYTGATGFEGAVHADWEPPFLSESIPGLLISGIAGVSTVSTENEDGQNVNTVGFLIAAGLHYEIVVGRVEFRPGVYGGVQLSTFGGIEADNQIAALISPHGEVAYSVLPNITAGVYVASKLLFYESLEASVTIGPRIRYTF
ncbi:MAG: hypothetical protein ACOCYB_10270 [Alkalispirochaeta sp.]